MKIGVLIIFNNNESIIEVQKFIELFVERKQLNVCFVNNASSDNTLNLLHEIKEEAKVPISIIDVKKDRGDTVAIKAGVRYLNSAKDLHYILCLQQYTAKSFSMLEKVFRVIQQENTIVKDLFLKTKSLTQKNVFSLHEILSKAS